MLVGSDLTLTATAVEDTDGTVESVMFYHDVDRDGLLNTSVDTRLGTDTFESDGWSLTTSTSGLTAASHTFFAQATDNDALTSEPTAMTCAVLGPTVSGMTAVDEGSPYTLKLTAGGIAVDFWTIDWGDGTGVETIQGNPSTITHVYVDGPAGHSITVTATDEDGTYTVGSGAAGMLDPNFGNGGLVTSNVSYLSEHTLFGAGLQSDGGIVVSGNGGYSSGGGMIRYRSDGTRDIWHLCLITDWMKRPNRTCGTSLRPCRRKTNGGSRPSRPGNLGTAARAMSRKS